VAVAGDGGRGEVEVSSGSRKLLLWLRLPLLLHPESYAVVVGAFSAAAFPPLRSSE